MTDPSSCQQLADAQRDKALELPGCAQELRDNAGTVTASMAGAGINAYSGWCDGTSASY